MAYLHYLPQETRALKRRKGQVEIHFNWIFVLIIGAVILAFFLFVIARQSAVSDQRLVADVLADMELILTGQGVSAGREDIITIPKLPMQFSCDDYGTLKMSRRVGNAIIFAPRTIESEQLLAWTQEWGIPFKVTNLLYVTSPDVRYYFIYDPADEEAARFATELGDSLPERMQKTGETIAEAPSILGEAESSVRLVYIFPAEGGPALPPGLWRQDDQTVSALAIRKIGGIEEVYRGGAMLEFYRKRGNRLELDTLATEHGDRAGIYPALGRAPVYGAVFTDDFGLYECSMRKAFKRLKLIATVYNQRTNTLLSIAVPRCATYYGVAPFSAFAVIEPDDLIDRARAPRVAGELFASAEILENLNRNTIRASCTTLY